MEWGRGRESTIEPQRLRGPQTTMGLSGPQGSACARSLVCLPAVLLLALLLILTFPASSMATVSGPPILAGSEVGYPPFCVVNDQGEADGFAVELMRAALAAVGRRVAFVTGPWAQVRGWLETGTVQALPLVHRTAEREQIFDFSFSYMTMYGVIVVRDDSVGINNVADLRGRDVAVMKGDSAEEYLGREDRGIYLHTTVSFEEALRGLSQGEYDAVVMQHLVASRLIGDTGLTNLKIVGQPIADYRQELCFAVKEGDTDLLALLNKGLGIVMNDGTYRRLYAKWFGAVEVPRGRPLVVGGDSSFPPFEYLDETGHPAGYNVDLTYAIAQAVGLPVEVRLGPWAEMRQALQVGDIDVLQGMFYSPERDELFDFTPAHLVTHGVAIVRKDAGQPPRTVEELQGRRIAVQRGDIMHDWALGQGLEAQLLVTESPLAALEAVSDAQADCALIERLVALYYIKETGLRDLVVGSIPLLTSEYCYAVREGRSALLAQFTEGLTLVKQSGEYRRIYDKWLGVYEEPRPSVGRTLRYVAYAAGPLVVILLLVFAWSWSLRRQVARRTEELRRSEEQLRQAQKMEALGRLAGGIAHDFNNLLTAILGYSELLLSDEQACSSRARQDLLEIRQAAERGSSLTRQILAFSRRQALRPEVVSLNEVLDGLTPMLERTVGEDIELITVKARDLGHAEVDVHQLEQVVMNLVVNARDAMPSGGKLVLETANVELDEEYARHHPEVVPGRYVMLAVSDTGVGMDKETLEHAFEPFFTTKEKGQGTGLGLAVVYGIVKQSRGHISAYSEPGRGSTFRVYLPRVDAVSALEKSVAETSLAPRGKERVMVVEDEPGLRRLAERVLSQAGYQVACYGTADEALAAVQRGEEMDLLLTDVVLPGGLQGRDLAARIHELRPRTHVLFMSGYSQDVAQCNGGLEVGAELLQKPFTPEALIRKVREVLDRVREAAAEPTD